MRAAYMSKPGVYFISEDDIKLATQGTLFFGNDKEIQAQIATVEGVQLDQVRINNRVITILPIFINTKGKTLIEIILEAQGKGPECAISGLTDAQRDSIINTRVKDIFILDHNIGAYINIGLTRIYINKPYVDKVKKQAEQNNKRHLTTGFISTRQLYNIFCTLSHHIDKIIRGPDPNICVNIVLRRNSKKDIINSLIRIFEFVKTIDKEKTWRTKEWREIMTKLKPFFKNFPHPRLKKILITEERARKAS